MDDLRERCITAAMACEEWRTFWQIGSLGPLLDAIHAAMMAEIGRTHAVVPKSILSPHHLFNARHCIQRALSLVDEKNFHGALYQLTNATTHLQLHLREEPSIDDKAQCDSIPAKDGDVQVP